MIKGTKRQGDNQQYEEYDRDLEYHLSLDHFEGVEGHAYGITDELHDLKKIIELVGEMVVKEEREFKEIERNDADSEFGFLGAEVLRAWHKKMIRPFSYKYFLMGIHTTFNDAMISFYDLLVAEKRIADTIHPKNKNVLDILKELQYLDSELPAIYDQVRGFNFMRNRITHDNGYYAESKRDHDAFNKLVKSRNDIQVDKLSFSKGDFTRRVKVLRSAVLVDYIEVIKKVFAGLVRGAHNLKYIP